MAGKGKLLGGRPPSCHYGHCEGCTGSRNQSLDAPASPEPRAGPESSRSVPDTQRLLAARLSATQSAGGYHEAVLELDPAPEGALL